MITQERYDMLVHALNTGANISPIDFQNMDEYELEHYCGLGVRVYPQERPVKVQFLYETEMEGQKVFCGISMTLNPEAPLKSLAEYEKIAEKCEVDGIPKMGIKPGALKRITIEDYERDYQEDEEIQS